jgi:hypothetical protein
MRFCKSYKQIISFCLKIEITRFLAYIFCFNYIIFDNLYYFCSKFMIDLFNNNFKYYESKHY